MLFHSTRGKDSNKTFEEVLMQGLAQDGGLFIPDYWPEVNMNDLRSCDNFIDVANISFLCLLIHPLIELK